MTERCADWINDTILWPVEDAPKDGSVIIMVYDDGSGVLAVRYGVPPSNPEHYFPGWWTSDWVDLYGENLSGAMGWIKPPEEIKWREGR